MGSSLALDVAINAEVASAAAATLEDFSVNVNPRRQTLRLFRLQYRVSSPRFILKLVRLWIKLLLRLLVAFQEIPEWRLRVLL
jgi:hypothetical protein